METEKIWKNFHDQLLGYIQKQVQDKETAHDLLQEVFIKIHTNLRTLEKKSALTSWIYSITQNVITDYYRQKHRRENSDIDPDQLIVPEEETDSSEFCKECLQPFIQELPQKDKEALLATELGHLTQKEYAAEMGLSYSALKSRVQRSRQKLFRMFRECCFRREFILKENNRPCYDCGCPVI